MALPFHSLFCFGGFNVRWLIYTSDVDIDIDLSYSANRAIDHFSINSPGLMSTSLRRWVSCQVVMGSALILSVEMQFMVRGERYIPYRPKVSYHLSPVCVLYRCSTRMVLALLFLILCEVVFAIVGLVLKPDIGIHSNNVALLSPDSFIYFGYV
jgi:hypothetical protein